MAFLMTGLHENFHGSDKGIRNNVIYAYVRSLSIMQFLLLKSLYALIVIFLQNSLMYITSKIEMDIKMR